MRFHRATLGQAMFVGLLVFFIPMPAHADDQAFQAVDLKTSRPVYFLKNHPYAVTRVLVRSRVGTTWCYTLRPDAKAELPAKYMPVYSDVIRVNNLYRMAWIAEQAPLVGHPLKPYDPNDAIAQQIAIWSYAKGGKITSETVPNKELRKRAKELRSAADRTKDTDAGFYYIGFNLQVNVVKSTYDKVTLEASLRDERGEALGGRTIRILWNGVEIKKAKTDNNGIINVSRPRPDRLVTLSAEWPNAVYVPGMFLAPDDPRKATLITNEEFNIGLRTERILDPATLTSGPQLLYQTLNDGLIRIFGTAGQKAAAAMVLLALAGPYVVGIVTVLGKLFRWRGGPGGNASATAKPTPRADKRNVRTRLAGGTRRREAAHQKRTYTSGD